MTTDKYGLVGFIKLKNPRHLTITRIIIPIVAITHFCVITSILLQTSNHTCLTAAVVI